MKILYLGLDPARYPHTGELTHLPIIKIVPRPFDEAMKHAFEQLGRCSHVLFTSRTAVGLYKEFALKAGCPEKELQEKIYVSVGKATAQAIKVSGLTPTYTAEEETAEGMIALLVTLDLHQAAFFFPRSAQGRTLLLDYLAERKANVTAIDIYDTLSNVVALPDIEVFDEIIFTSPSTVNAFFALAKKKNRHQKNVAPSVR